MGTAVGAANIEPQTATTNLGGISDIELILAREDLGADNTPENNIKVAYLIQWANRMGTTNNDARRVLFHHVLSRIQNNYGQTKLDSIHGWIKVSESAERLWAEGVPRSPIVVESPACSIEETHPLGGTTSFEVKV